MRSSARSPGRRPLRAVVVAGALLAGCGSPPERVAPATDVADAAVASVDAEVADAAIPAAEQAFLLDELALTGQNQVFALLGMGVLNQQLAEQIATGQLLWIYRLRDLDDLGTDDAVEVGLFFGTDEDGDPSDNFDPDAPETMGLSPLLTVEGEPLVLLDDSAITDGALMAAATEEFELPGINFPLQNPTLSGELVTDETGAILRELRAGRLTTDVTAQILAIVPNPLGDSCPGANLLDVLISGCGLLSVQPDADLDGDGLERFHDDDGDGAIDRCEDGDGTEVTGASCVQDPGMADGYRLVFRIHGVRVLIGKTPGA